MRKNQGFTLIEVLVSVSIFAITMLVAAGAVFTVVESNKKTHALKSVMTNLNFALEAMARDIRVGTNYICNGVGDCQNGGTVFRYKANRDIDGSGTYDAADSYDQAEYSLVSERLNKRVYGTGPIAALGAVPITAQEIHITSLKFYLTGAPAGDGNQPKVVISLQGYAGIGSTKSTFNIQTTITQRSIDS